MSFEFLPSDCPLKDVLGVGFGILSPEEIRRYSIVKVEHVELYENKEPKVGGLVDVRMGCVDRNMECYTCGATMNNCPGHFGHIELTTPVYHVEFLKTVKKILECVCHRCARFRLLPTDHRYKKLLHVKEKFKYAYDNAKNKLVCDYPDCESQLLPLRKQGITLYFDPKKIDKKMARIPLPAGEARKILERISDETCRLIGLNPEQARPEWMIITVLMVPPPCVRPSISMDNSNMSHDDLTHMLTNIVKYNNLAKKHENTRSAAEFREQLQNHVTNYINNDVKGVPPSLQKGGRPVKSITVRMKGKDGLIRGHLMGKRVNFSARTVITGDPHISIEEVGMPRSMARNLTFPERVTPYNVEHLQRLVNNSPDYPGAKFIIREDGSRVNLHFAARKPSIKVGDLVERHLQDGDWIIFNRQPTLHKMSMMGHRIRVMPFSTFRLNVNVCASYNADFDGDEMNAHIPQSYPTVAEIQTLSRVSNLLVSPQANKPVNALVQDGLCGIRQLTRRDIFLDAEEMMNLVMWIGGTNTAGQLPTPAILKPVPLWTGKQLLSTMLPPIDLRGFHSIHSAKLEEFKQRQPPPSKEELERWEHLTPWDTRVLIENGELLSGTICKRTAGATAGSIVHVIWVDHGPDAARNFIDNASQVVVQWMLRTGFSVGIGDAILGKEVGKKIFESIDEQYQKAEVLSKMYREGELVPPGNMSAEEAKENKLQEFLAKARDTAGALANKSLPGFNNVKQMVEAGSKGSVLNICQISASVGQQIVEGKRIPFGFKERTLPHFSKYDDHPDVRGFVKNSFIKGLQPHEVFFHAMGGREGLIDTAVKSVTKDTAIVIVEEKRAKYVRIGDWIDAHLERNAAKVKRFPENRNLELLNLDRPTYIPTCDAFGNVTWGALTAVTRHDPGDVLYKITTRGGRKVTVTASKSLLIWDARRKRFVEKDTTDVVLGDFVPVNAHLPPPPVSVQSVSLASVVSVHHHHLHLHHHLHDSSPVFELNRENGVFVGSYLGDNEKDSLFLESFVGSGDQKRVPDIAYVAPQDFTIGILEGFFGKGNEEGGGGQDGQHGTQVTTITSPRINSQQLCDGLSILCARINVFARVSSEDHHRLHIEGRWANRFAQTIWRRQANIFQESEPETERQPNRSQDVVLDAIVEIKLVGVEDNPKMYDVTVPSTLNFCLSNGMGCRDTSETGYIQRRLIKAFEDLVVKYDGTVRNSRDDIIQFFYGEDGFDGTAIENQYFDTLLISNREFEKRYYVEELQDTEWKQLWTDREFLRNNLRVQDDKWALPLNLKRMISRAKRLFPAGEPPSYGTVHDKIRHLRKTLRPSKLNMGVPDYNPSELFAILLTSTLSAKQVVDRWKMSADAFGWMVEEISTRYRRGLIHPGESVGIVAAQSIGEPATQMTLNVFHLSGTGNKAVTTGIPRLKELINAVKNIKTPGMTIHLLPEICRDALEARKVKAMVEHCPLSALIRDYAVYYDPDYRNSCIPEDRKWLDVETAIPDPDAPEPDALYPWLFRATLKRDILLEKDISIRHVAEKIEDVFDRDLYVLHSDDNDDELVVHIRLWKDREEMENEAAAENGDDDVMTDQEFVSSIHLELLECTTIKGIPGVDKAFISQKQMLEYDDEGNLSGNKREFIIETDGINIRDAMKVPGVDVSRIHCNDPHEMLSVFGIEVARETLMEEVRSVIESGGSYINYRHLCLLCEVMTNRGQIMAITRHGMNKSDAGPLTKCTFEQTVDILTDAAVFGEIDEIRGVAENVMMGQVADIGTGMMDLLLDEDLLARMPPAEGVNDDEKDEPESLYEDEYLMDVEGYDEYFRTNEECGNMYIEDHLVERGDDK